MSESDFWTIVDQVVQKAGNAPFQNNDIKVKYVEEVLKVLSKEALYEFERWLRKKVVEADHWNVIGFMEIALLAGTDDTYLYARYGLVMEGKKIFDQAIHDTDSLADITDGDSELEGECFMRVTDRVFKDKFGSPENYMDFPTSKAQDIGGYTQGQKMKYEDLPVRFPKLCAKFDYIP